MRIPVEFELPGDRVLIHREGSKHHQAGVAPHQYPGAAGRVAPGAAMAPEDQFPPSTMPPVQPEGPAVSGYLLDTNIISDLIRNPSGRLLAIRQLGAKGHLPASWWPRKRAMVAPEGSPVCSQVQALLKRARTLDLPADGD